MKANKKTEGNKLVAIIGDEVLIFLIQGYRCRIFVDWNRRKERQRVNKLYDCRLEVKQTRSLNYIQKVP